MCAGTTGGRGTGRRWTGAELRFVPEGEEPPQGGIGALLRYQAPQT